jgi:phage tail-like protein
MAASAVRVLLTHRDPTIHRRLRQALLGEPDIEVLDVDGEARRDGSLAEQVRVFNPDILLTDHLSDDGESRQMLNVLQSSPTPTRVVLVNGQRPLVAPPVPVDQYLPETASRIDILRAIRLVQAPSTYLNYLPGIFTRDDFLGRFLRIFESVLGPIETQVGNLEHYLDPDLAPALFLPWLASWLDVTLDDRWPRERQVAPIRAAPNLHRWRGTRRGLIEHLRLYLGVEPEIEETAGGLRLGPSTQLGFRTVLGESGPRHHFTVTVRVPDPRAIDYTVVAALIDAQKPAHCTYSLSILPVSTASDAIPATPSPAPRGQAPRTTRRRAAGRQPASADRPPSEDV